MTHIFKTPSRRGFLAGGSALLAAPALLRSTRAYAANPVLRVGHVSPRTGPLAGFAEADDYVLQAVAEAFAGGIENNGKTWSVEIISKDSQSNPNRAAEVAADLILGDEVDLIVAASTPDTVNPVSDQAEINEVPCITTDCPWQPYFFGRNGVPGQGFDYTYHFFWGLEDVIAAFLDMWDATGVQKVVGGLFPNDADGNAWGDPELGLPKPLAAAGYALTDPGRYQPLTDDFSTYIAAFKEVGAEIVTGNMIAPDFATFWAQAAQQGFSPKIVTIGKALLFPSVIEALGDRGDGLSSEVWWSPSHPFSSSLTGASARELAEGYAAASGRPWTQPIGFKHALFEVVADVLRRAEDLEDYEAIAAAVGGTKLDTIVGPVDWSTGPVRNVSKTPLVAGQWQKEAEGYDLKIVANSAAPQIPLTGEMKLLG
ncbi:ABC transporter substrate-binding protein (plasmid) [Pacificitalea manganoxidans]|jgi:branched-chain amino acid transport system substrate-binding protein|uniref:ABC transporter substrate-binding protein n=1 Tax=Pacificitalea manganoxidans TaxID=1411902 RepID=A0A291M4Q9_9RHOB|nr:ABC transporter substrate-binding protein [Pacificitalea manganoxidans]MAQ45221.1 ABC transporter substrate-binding protein [Actibacterium sp.]OWU66455.1 ABC transporter substrate-binding protein [Roseovarius sp. 22II1-1F6A]ATI41986.1 ABC transporter substrate-binding protein [Pacificitalea manganoxidans]ATI43909.1 ABC transporter substrate-binding protein [Pacificitalea manganoxidans]MAQ45322.1 ABC transporter substrate-binding protein [Actibacterium sp.]|tara:strand:- start:2827 stop:4107 length:1281 start_codon:yes stop_codon:yes gene_type:complete